LTHSLGVSRTQLHINSNFKLLNVNSLFFYNHDTFLTPHHNMHHSLPHPSHMDSQLSPEDYALLDDNTNTIPETLNLFGNLIRRLGQRLPVPFLTIPIPIKLTLFNVYTYLGYG